MVASRLGVLLDYGLRGGGQAPPNFAEGPQVHLINEKILILPIHDGKIEDLLSYVIVQQ